MDDSLMAVIPTLAISSIILTDPKNFKFIASLPAEMIDRVPIENPIISEYKNLPASRARDIPPGLQVLFKEKPKRGGKRKTQSHSSPKPKQRKTKPQRVVIKEEAEEEEEEKKQK